MIHPDFKEGFVIGINLWQPVIKALEKKTGLLGLVRRHLASNVESGLAYLRQLDESEYLDDHPVLYPLVVTLLEWSPVVMVYDNVMKFYAPQKGLLGAALTEELFRFHKATHLRVVE